MKLLIVLATLLASTASFAQECVPQAEMQEIAKHFTQFQNLANKDYCYDGSHEAHLIAGIEFMRKTQYQNPMDRSKDDLFSGKFAADWWGYFTGRITEFEIDDSCPKGVIAYVYSFGGSTMYACTAALTDNFTGLDLASVFMHEARHIDGFPHMMCTHGPREGLQGACDNRISDTGSYAVTVETYSQLARYAVDVHPALKAYARSAAIVYADEAFETTVRIERAQRFLVLAKDKKFHSLNTDGKTQALGMAPELGRIVMRSQHMILFPQDANHNARFVFARGEGEVATLPGDQANEYNSLPVADRANFVALHVGAQWNARVYKDKVRFNCDPRSPQTKELAIGDVGIGMIYPNGYDRGAKSAQLMTQSGKVYDLACNNGSPSLQASNTSFDKAYKSIYKVGNLVLGLTEDGFVREIQGTSSRAFSLGNLDGSIYELVPNYSVGFFNEQ